MNRVAGVLLAVAATAGLASCEKPPPRVTFFSGTTSQWVAPVCFSWTGEIDAQQCLQDAAGDAASGQTVRLTVVPDDVVGISVDPAIADNGWTPTLAGTPLSDQPLTTTYFRFTFPRVQANPQGYPLAVISQGGDEPGVWAVRIDVQKTRE
jgi:hypothetical protein